MVIAFGIFAMRIYMQKYTYIMKRAEPAASTKEKVSFVASSATPDRYGDIIDQKDGS